MDINSLAINLFFFVNFKSLVIFNELLNPQSKRLLYSGDSISAFFNFVFEGFSDEIIFIFSKKIKKNLDYLDIIYFSKFKFKIK